MLELAFVAAPELLQTAIHRFLEVLEASLVRLGERFELHGERLELRGLRFADLGDRLDQGLGAGLVRPRNLLAELARAGRRLLA